METNLCVAGFGGQGVMTLGKFLASATCDATNKNVTFFPQLWRRAAWRYRQLLRRHLR